MAAQTASREQDSMMANFFKSQKKALEINPRHPLIQGLLESIEVGEDVKDAIWTLWDTSMVRSGFPLKDPVGCDSPSSLFDLCQRGQADRTSDPCVGDSYFNRVEKLLRRSVGVQESAKVDQSHIRPAPEVDVGPLPLSKEPDEWMDFAQFKEQRNQQKAGVEHDEL